MFSIPDGIESKFRYAKSNDDRNADNQSNVILSQNVNSNPYQDNRQTNDSDTTEDPDQQSLANQMRAFQKSMLENRRTFQVTMTDTITEKMTQMFSQLNRSSFVDNNTQHVFNTIRAKTVSELGNLRMCEAIAAIFLCIVLTEFQM